MNDFFVTNILSYIQALSETVDEFNELLSHCPEPVTDVNDFLCRHLDTLTNRLRFELLIARLVLSKEDNDE